MKVSIGMLSDTYGLTPEALRYYEEKGLLTPERGKGGRNRRFSLDDVQRMGIIKSLQRQGFSLNEIRRVMTGCPLDELIAMVDDKRAELSRQLRISSAIHERMTAGAYLLRDAERLQMQPRLSAGCAAYFIDFASPADLWAHVGDCPVLKDLIGAFPLTTYSTIVPLARLRGEDVPLRTGIAAPAEYAAAVQTDFTQMRMAAGPRSVRVLFELGLPQSRSMPPVVDRARRFLAENGLTPICEAYTRQYMWFVDETGQKRHFSELIVPIGA